MLSLINFALLVYSFSPTKEEANVDGSPDALDYIERQSAQAVQLGKVNVDSEEKQNASSPEKGSVRSDQSTQHRQSSTLIPACKFRVLMDFMGHAYSTSIRS